MNDMFHHESGYTLRLLLVLLYQKGQLFLARLSEQLPNPIHSILGYEAVDALNHILFLVALWSIALLGGIIILQKLEHR